MKCPRFDVLSRLMDDPNTEITEEDLADCPEALADYRALKALQAASQALQDEPLGTGQARRAREALMHRVEEARFLKLRRADPRALDRDLSPREPFLSPRHALLLVAVALLALSFSMLSPSLGGRAAPEAPLQAQRQPSTPQLSPELSPRPRSVTKASMVWTALAYQHPRALHKAQATSQDATSTQRALRRLRAHQMLRRLAQGERRPG